MWDRLSVYTDYTGSKHALESRLNKVKCLANKNQNIKIVYLYIFYFELNRSLFRWASYPIFLMILLSKVHNCHESHSKVIPGFFRTCYFITETCCKVLQGWNFQKKSLRKRETFLDSYTFCHPHLYILMFSSRCVWKRN